MRATIEELLIQLKIESEFSRFLPTVVGVEALGVETKEIKIVCQAHQLYDFETQLIKHCWNHEEFKILKSYQRIEARFKYQGIIFKMIATPNDIFEQIPYKATYIIQRFSEETNFLYTSQLVNYLSQFREFEEGVATLLNLAMSFEEIRNYLKRYSQSIVEKLKVI